MRRELKKHDPKAREVYDRLQNDIKKTQNEKTKTARALMQAQGFGGPAVSP